MGLLSIFKRPAGTAPKPTPAGDESDPVQKARTRARQRLIGAALLVGLGVIGFPLVFETQPRPIPVDIPIEIQRKDGAAPLVIPAARTPAAPAPSASTLARAPAESPAAAPVAARPEVSTESHEDAGRDVAPVAPPRVPASAVAVVPSPKAAAPGTDGVRAKALLEGKSPVASESGRFVVQVGAFADAGAARETRLRVEKLGLKTYTQVASTAAGERIRVRVGPFATRDDADRALAKARGAGLSAVVLTL